MMPLCKSNLERAPATYSIMSMSKGCFCLTVQQVDGFVHMGHRLEEISEGRELECSINQSVSS